MLKIKKLLPLAITLFLVTQIALAAEGIEISLNAYDSETTIAKISLHNGATKDYHEVTLALDSLSSTKIVDTLATGTTILYPVAVPSGEHKITVTTKEGETFSKDLYFAKTQTQIQEEIQKEQEVQAEKEKKYQQIAEEKEKIESMQIKDENETEETETPTASKETTPKPQLSKDLILRIILGITIVAFLGYIIFITIKEKTKKAYLFLLLGALLFLVKPTDAYLGCCSDTCYESGICCGAGSIWYQGCEDSNSQLYCPTQVLGDCANCFSTTPEVCTWYLNDTNCAANKECNIDGNMTNPISSHCLCKEGYTLCADGSCQTDCSGNGGDPTCVINAVCDSGESCMCEDCAFEHADNCSEGLVCIDGLCKQQLGACTSCSECDDLGPTSPCTLNQCTVTCGGQPCYFAGNKWPWEDCGACDGGTACGDYEDTESTCGADTCGLANCFWDNVTTNCKTCTTCEDYSDQSMCETNDCSLDECHWCSATGCGESKPRNKCVTVPDDDMDGICNAGDTDPLCTGSDACPNTPLGVEVSDEGCSEAQSSCLLEWDCTSSAWSSCEKGIRTRDPCIFIGAGNSTCDQPEFEPALTKACSTASLFSFFTTSNLLIVLLILIAFYVWQTSNKPKRSKKHKKKHKKKARRHKKK